MFVGGLDPSVTETDLFNYFKKFGTVTKVKIVQSHGKSRGFGFVHFDCLETLERVCAMKFLEIRGREIDCKIANSELREQNREEYEDPNKISKIFIKDVPLFIKKSEIMRHYSKFGRVKEVLLIVRPNKDTAFSYIKFHDFLDASKAVRDPQEIRKGLFLEGELALPKNSKRLKELQKNYAKYAYNIEINRKEKSFIQR